MKTRLLPATSAGIAQAAAILRAEGLVAFPTETVYGLGANALSEIAVAKVFAAKGRPAEDPLIVHLATIADLAQVVSEISPLAERLANVFWPGALTLILPRHPAIVPAVSAQRATVAVRVPSHPIAQTLIAAAGVPIAAPSANRFGHTSPTTAAHVLSDLDGRIEALIDGGSTPIGVESSVLDLSGDTPTLLRPGGVSLEALEALIGPVKIFARPLTPPSAGGLLSPGLLERHYAPESELWLVIGPRPQALEWMQQRSAHALAAGQRVGLLISEDDRPAFAEHAVLIESLGPSDDLGGLAQRLYAGLRRLDAQNPDLILARDFGTSGIGLALRDRLSRAASGRIVDLSAD